MRKEKVDRVRNVLFSFSLSFSLSLSLYLSFFLLRCYERVRERERGKKDICKWSSFLHVREGEVVVLVDGSYLHPSGTTFNNSIIFLTIERYQSTPITWLSSYLFLRRLTYHYPTCTLPHLASPQHCLHTSHF